MSTRFIISDSIFGVDDQIENIEDEIAGLLLDDINVHDFLSESITIIAAELTRLTTENIITNREIVVLQNTISVPQPIVETIAIEPDNYHPIFTTDIANRNFDYSIESTILASNRELILANTANNLFSVILPTSAKIGTTISIVDYSITFDINCLTVTTSGIQKIANSFDDYPLGIPNLYNFIYTGEQFGWILSNDNSESKLIYVNGYYKVCNHNKILADSTGGPFSLFLNETPEEYEHFTIIDINNAFGNNPVYLDANGQQILGSRSLTLDIVDLSISFIYHTNKWIYVEDLPSINSNVIDVIDDYYCNNNDYMFLGANLTITLHPTPNIGDIVVFIDNCDTSVNNVTINSNGSMINGGDVVDNLVIDIKYNSFTLIYVNPSKGWLIKG